MTATTTSPVSFVVDVRRLPQRGFPVSIDADATQRAELATTHGLISVESFAAELLVQTWKRDGIRITGKVRASVTQECIVTLEPLGAEVDEEIEALFVPEDSPLAKPNMDEGEMFLSADGPDAPELFDGERIDAGAVAEEFFALALDPYPRKAGVELQNPAGADKESSPFEKLRARLQKD